MGRTADLSFLDDHTVHVENEFVDLNIRALPEPLDNSRYLQRLRLEFMCGVMHGPCGHVVPSRRVPPFHVCRHVLRQRCCAACMRVACLDVACLDPLVAPASSLRGIGVSMTCDASMHEHRINMA